MMVVGASDGHVGVLLSMVLQIAENGSQSGQTTLVRYTEWLVVGNKAAAVLS